MSEAHKLLSEIEAAAAALDLSPTTISRMAGQGGGFPARLKGNKRVWPETADKVRRVISKLMAERGAA